MKPVPARGPSNAKIIVVGESPGLQEEREGKPFVGPSGRDMEIACSRAGIDFNECYITNAHKLRPTGRQDKHAHFFLYAKGFAPTDDFSTYIVEMIQEILAVREAGGGNVVVALGNYALWALTGEWGITKWRGSILESHIIPGLKVIPSLHPAYFMRGKEAEKVLLVWDLRRAREESDDPSIVLPNPEYILDPTQDQISVAIDKILHHGTFTFDTEWYTADDLACIGFTSDPSWAICMDAALPECRAAFKELLSSDCQKYAHNAMFDCIYLERGGYPVKMVADDSTRLIQDTMVGHFVCWPDLRKGLDLVASVYTRFRYYKDDYKIWKEAGRVDETMLHVYNCNDVCATDTAREAIFDPDGELDWTGCRKTYELNMQTFHIMAKATLLGIRGDWEELATQIAYHTKRARLSNDLLAEILGRRINVRSSVQVAKLVFDDMGFGKKRKRSTAQPILMDLAAQETDEFKKTVLTLIVSIRRDENALSKYVNETLFDFDGRLRSMWNMAGTEYGRKSASKDKWRGTGVSLQTMPEQVRGVCIADPGTVFFIPDLAQAEARVVAYLSEDWQIIEWLEAGEDTHCKTAEILFGIPYEEVGEESRERYLAKRCRHALNYMMGARELKMTINKDYIDTGIGITEAQAKVLRQKYLDLHAPLLMWWDKVKQQVARDGAVTNCFGRRRRFTERWGDKMFKSAVAGEPQSTVADLNQTGLVRVAQACPDVTILVDTHDGSLMQVPEAKVEEYKELIPELLSIPIRVNNYEFTIPVELKIADRWGPKLEVKNET